MSTVLPEPAPTTSEGSDEGGVDAAEEDDDMDDVRR
jgi:hypothetical protein